MVNCHYIISTIYYDLRNINFPNLLHERINQFKYFFGVLLYLEVLMGSINPVPCCSPKHLSKTFDAHDKTFFMTFVHIICIVQLCHNLYWLMDLTITLKLS